MKNKMIFLSILLSMPFVSLANSTPNDPSKRIYRSKNQDLTNDLQSDMNKNYAQQRLNNEKMIKNEKELDAQAKIRSLEADQIADIEFNKNKDLYEKIKQNSRFNCLTNQESDYSITNYKYPLAAAAIAIISYLAYLKYQKYQASKKAASSLSIPETKKIVEVQKPNPNPDTNNFQSKNLH